MGQGIGQKSLVFSRLQLDMCLEYRRFSSTSLMADILSYVLQKGRAVSCEWSIFRFAVSFYQNTGEACYFVDEPMITYR